MGNICKCPATQYLHIATFGNFNLIRASVRKLAYEQTNGIKKSFIVILLFDIGMVETLPARVEVVNRQ